MFPRGAVCEYHGLIVTRRWERFSLSASRVSERWGENSPKDMRIEPLNSAIGAPVSDPARWYLISLSVLCSFPSVQTFGVHGEGWGEVHRFTISPKSLAISDRATSRCTRSIIVAP